ncbi:MAG: alcohol dehydrogenase catalytic domain-containing protein, partial [Oscillospiraceae bacterium]|nr:alcohol dehydrogenase catalytic domain-containing protein [Oscillospiraceae bacterium]
MALNEIDIQALVKSVIAEMNAQNFSSPASPAAGSAQGGIPKTARVAMLTSLEHYDIKEFPIPELGDGDILVKVEGCGICGTDAHEFKRDPFGLIPVVLGHEGTGEIVKMGKNVKKDSAGKDLH